MQIACASASPPRVIRLIIGLDAAVKGLAEGPHPLRDGLVADAHLAQIVVHVLAEAVEQGLRQLRPALGDGPQPAQQQPEMQQQQVETAVNRIGHAQVPVKYGFSRLRHDHAIDGLNGAGRG